MRHDSDGRRLPIKLDSTSNGEVAPMPLEPVHLHANALAHQAAVSSAGTGRGATASAASTSS